MYPWAHKPGACNYHEDQHRPYTCSPPVQTAVPALALDEDRLHPLQRRAGNLSPPHLQRTSRETGKPPQAAAVRCSSFLSKGSTAPALGHHRGSINGCCWAQEPQLLLVYTFLQPPLPKVICPLMNTPSAVYFFAKRARLFSDYHIFKLTQMTDRYRLNVNLQLFK